MEICPELIRLTVWVLAGKAYCTFAFTLQLQTPRQKLPDKLADHRPVVHVIQSSFQVGLTAFADQTEAAFVNLYLWTFEPQTIHSNRLHRRIRRYIYPRIYCRKLNGLNASPSLLCLWGPYLHHGLINYGPAKG